MRNLGICTVCVSGYFADHKAYAVAALDFDSRFHNYFEHLGSWQRYGQSLNFIGFGNDFTCEGRCKRVEVSIDLEFKTYVLDRRFKGFLLPQLSKEQLIHEIVVTLVLAVRFTKEIAMGDFDKVLFENDMAAFLQSEGFDYNALHKQVEVDFKDVLENPKKFLD